MPIPDAVREMIAAGDLCALATAGPDGPYCSLMSYLTDEGCGRIYLVTKRGGRKYANLTAEPAVSLLIDDRDKTGADRSRARALTIVGRAALLDRSEAGEVLERFNRERPHLAAIVADPAAVVVAVTIQRVLLLDGAIAATAWPAD